MSRIIALERRGTWASRLGSLPTGTSISLHGTITVSSMLATARENRSMANTTLCWENSLFVWSNDIVFLNVEFRRSALGSMEDVDDSAQEAARRRRWIS